MTDEQATDQDAYAQIKNEFEFLSAVFDLVNLIRDHPGTEAAKHLRPFLRCMVFDLPVEMNLYSMLRILDPQIVEKVILIMELRQWAEWPDYCISDADLEALTDTKKAKEESGPEIW